MDGLILIAAIAAAVWAAVVFLRGGPLAGCLIFLVAAACFNSDFLTIDLGALRLTIDRLLWVVLMAQYFMWRQRGWTDPKPFRRTDVVLLALVGYLTLRTFTADWSVDGSTPVVHLVLCYIMPLGVYWIVRQSRYFQGESMAVVGFLTLLGIYMAVTLAAERFEAYWLVYPKFIVETLSSKKLEFIGRGRGPLLNPMISGIVLAVCWAATLLWWPRWNRAGRLVLLGLSALCIVATYATMTRTVWIGAALSVGILLGAGIPRSWRIPLLGGALLASSLLASVYWEQLVAFKRDRNLTAKETASSVYVRPVLAMVAWHMFQDRPLFGCGFDQYVREHKFYLADRSTELNLELARGNVPHNVLFAFLTETGILGLALFVALLILWGWDAWRLWRTLEAPLWVRQQGLLLLATMAAYLVNGMFHHVAFIPMSNTLLFFVAGTVEALQPWRQGAPAGVTIAWRAPWSARRSAAPGPA